MPLVTLHSYRTYIDNFGIEKANSSDYSFEGFPSRHLPFQSLQ